MGITDGSEEFGSNGSHSIAISLVLRALVNTHQDATALREELRNLIEASMQEAGVPQAAVAKPLDEALRSFVPGFSARE